MEINDKVREVLFATSLRTLNNDLKKRGNEVYQEWLKGMANTMTDSVIRLAQIKLNMDRALERRAITELQGDEFQRKQAGKQLINPDLDLRNETDQLIESQRAGQSRTEKNPGLAARDEAPLTISEQLEILVQARNNITLELLDTSPGRFQMPQTVAERLSWRIQRPFAEMPGMLKDMVRIGKLGNISVDKLRDKAKQDHAAQCLRMREDSASIQTIIGDADSAEHAEECLDLIQPVGRYVLLTSTARKYQGTIERLAGLAVTRRNKDLETKLVLMDGAKPTIVSFAEHFVEAHTAELDKAQFELADVREILQMPLLRATA